MSNQPTAAAAALVLSLTLHSSISFFRRIWNKVHEARNGRTSCVTAAQHATLTTKTHQIRVCMRRLQIVCSAQDWTFVSCISACESGAHAAAAAAITRSLNAADAAAAAAAYSLSSLSDYYREEEMVPGKLPLLLLLRYLRGRHIYAQGLQVLFLRKKCNGPFCFDLLVGGAMQGKV